jgi:glycine/D-amino acid oxidase-like deaminating enzyme
VHKTKVDYIIVGQGVAGSWLAHELIKRDKSIVVINHETDNTASIKAAGLYNPITGRKMVKTWMADELFENLENDYASLEKELSAHFIHPLPIYRSFRNVEDKNDWDGKQDDLSLNKFIKEIRIKSAGLSQINDPLGGIILNNCGYVDLPKFIFTFRNFLVNKESYLSEMFDHSELVIKEDEVNYKGLKADKIIFCEGPQIGNPYWKHLPFKLVRGELMDIECNINLPFIFNQGVFMIPKGNHIITIGSTYDHGILSFEPQASGIKNLRDRLDKVFTGSYKIIGERAGIRPATHDRKPFIGMHHKIKTLGIFNGFGTKGVSLTPYFAKHFADVLENKCELDKNVDVQRVS